MKLLFAFLVAALVTAMVTATPSLNAQVTELRGAVHGFTLCFALLDKSVQGMLAMAAGTACRKATAVAGTYPPLPLP